MFIPSHDPTPAGSLNPSYRPLPRRSRWWVAIGLGVGIGVLTSCSGSTRTSTPERPHRSAAVTLQNQTFDPLASSTNRALVLVFLSVECPICNRYAPELLRLSGAYAPQGVEFRLVYPNADESAGAIRKYLEEYQLSGLTNQVLLDPDHALVGKSGVRKTPEVAVLLPGAQLVYRGRIDDRFPALGMDRREPTRRDLETVLIAILQSKPLPTSGEPAVGCTIPSLH